MTVDPRCAACAAGRRVPVPGTVGAGRMRVAMLVDLTEGLAWMTTAAGLGIAVGSATAGQVVDARGTTVTFPVATGFAAGAGPGRQRGCLK